jgi:hypothetical protein
MDDKEIKRTWRTLITMFVIGVIVLTTAILFHRLGSKRPGPQTLWLFAGVFGVVFTVFPGIKIIKFRQYLRTRKDNNEDDSEN